MTNGTATIRSTGDLSGLHRCDMAVREVVQSAELSARFKASTFAQDLGEDVNAKVISSFLLPYQFKHVSLPAEVFHPPPHFEGIDIVMTDSIPLLLSSSCASKSGSASSTVVRVLPPKGNE
jgi:hypothetical protein